MLPLIWGMPGGFASLSLLSLADTQLTGPLPASWASNGSLPALTTLQLGLCNLTGTLPGDWGSPIAFQHLQTLSLVNCSISGTSLGTSLQPLPGLTGMQFACLLVCLLRLVCHPQSTGNQLQNLSDCALLRAVAADPLLRRISELLFCRTCCSSAPSMFWLVSLERKRKKSHAFRRHNGSL